MRIEDILREKNTGLVTIGASQSIHDAIGLLNKHSIGALVVRGEDEGIVGIITERDILRNCGESCHYASESNASNEVGCSSRVQHVMTNDVVSGAPDDDPNYAMAIMTKNHIRHLPILDDGDLVGILSIGDLVNAHLEEKVLQSQTLKDYISRNSTAEQS